MNIYGSFMKNTLERIDFMRKYISNPKNKYFSFDKTIHNVLGQFNRISNSNHKNLRVILSLLEEIWISIGYNDVQEEEYFKIRAYLMLISYFKNPLDQGLESLIINKFLKKSIRKNLVICKKIDKLYENLNGDFELIDYKYGKQIMHSESFELDIKSIFSIIVIKENLGIYPDIISYYYLSYCKKFSHFITTKDIRCIENYFLKLKDI